MALNLPAAEHGNLTAYEQPPNVNQLKEFFIELGYDKDAEDANKFKVLSAFKRKCLPTRWATLISILNRYVTSKEIGMDRDITSLYQIMYGIVKQCHFDYAKLLWIDVLDHVRRTEKKKNVCIPFVRYFKILIAQFMRQHPNITRRQTGPTPKVSYMHSTSGDSIVTTNAPMPIPQGLLDLANKESHAYKEYMGLVNAPMESSKPSGPTLDASRVKVKSRANVGKNRKRRK